jgi:hypothetical protein
MAVRRAKAPLRRDTTNIHYLVAIIASGAVDTWRRHQSPLTESVA